MLWPADRSLRLKEISFLEAGLLEAELIQERGDQARIVWSGPDKNVQVPSVTSRRSRDEMRGSPRRR
jgi:hypothetical protein